MWEGEAQSTCPSQGEPDFLGWFSPPNLAKVMRAPGACEVSAEPPVHSFNSMKTSLPDPVSSEGQKQTQLSTLESRCSHLHLHLQVPSTFLLLGRQPSRIGSMGFQ